MGQLEAGRHPVLFPVWILRVNFRLFKQTLLVIMTAAILSWWGVRCVKKGNDFLNHYEAALRATHAQDLYVPGAVSGLTYVYPPLYACLLTPLTWVNAKVAASCWYILKLALTAYTFWILWQWLAPTQTYSWKFSGLLLLSTGRCLIDDFQLGQLTLVVIELSLIGLYLKWKGKEGWAAVMLGLSIGLKLIPGIFLVYFLFRREYRFAAMTLVCCVGWSVLPAAWYGDALPWLMGRFVDQQLIGSAAMSPVSGADNQSLQGALMRLLGRFPTEMTVLSYANIANFSFEAIKRMVYVGDALALGWLWWLARRDPDGRISMAAAFMVMLIISPNSGKSYYAALMLAYAILIEGLVNGRWGNQAKVVRWALMGSLALVTFTADGWIGRGASDIASSYSVMLWGLVPLGVIVHRFRQGVPSPPIF